MRVPGVQRRVEIDQQFELAQRVLRIFGIGIGAVEVSAQADADLQFSSLGRFDAGQRVEPRRRGECHAELGLQPVEDGLLQFGGDADRPDPLHIRVTPNRQQSGVVTSDHAAQQRQVGDRFDALYSVGVMRDPHRPGEDDVFGGGVAGRDGVDRIGADSRFAVDVVPVGSGQIGLQRRPVVTVVRQERLVVSVHFDDAFGHSGQQGEIPADVRLHVQRRDLRPEEQADRIAGDAEIHQPGLDDRIDHDDMPAAAANVLERRHQPRMIAGRVAADDEHEVGVLDVFQHQRGRPGPQHAAQSDTARLMAVEAAIVDVVGPVHPGEDLQQEAGFVRTAPAEVPERFIRGDRLQLADDLGERIVPRDRLVVVLAAPMDHRLSQPAAGFEFARREGLQLRDRVRLEEVGFHRALHVRDHRLQRLLADFREDAPFVGHSPLLASHADRTGLAGVLGPHRLPQLPQPARLARLLKRVKHGGPAAPGVDSTHDALCPECSQAVTETVIRIFHHESHE